MPPSEKWLKKLLVVASVWLSVLLVVPVDVELMLAVAAVTVTPPWPVITSLLELMHELLALQLLLPVV